MEVDLIAVAADRVVIMIPAAVVVAIVVAVVEWVEAAAAAEVVVVVVAVTCHNAKVTGNAVIVIIPTLLGATSAIGL